MKVASKWRGICIGLHEHSTPPFASVVFDVHVLKLNFSNRSITFTFFCGVYTDMFIMFLDVVIFDNTSVSQFFSVFVIVPVYLRKISMIF